MRDNIYMKIMNDKKNLIIVTMIALVILMIIIYLLASGNMFGKVKEIETTIKKVIVYVGDKEDVKAQIQSTGNFSPMVKFRSKNGNFTLDDNIQYGENVKAEITGIEPGEDILVIKASKKGNKKVKTKEVDVLVCEKPEITNTSDKVLNVKENSITKLTFNIDNECFEGYDIEVENKSIATIDSRYNLSAKKLGTTKIVFKRNSDRIKYTINVVKEDTKVQEVRLNTDALNVEVGKTKKVSISIFPIDAINRKVTYTSSDNSVATVSKNGVIKGIKVGTATITITSSSDSTKRLSVTAKVYKSGDVIPKDSVKVSSIKFPQSSYTIAYNEIKEIPLRITPADATNKTITCKSLNNSIVTVTGSGNVCVIKSISPGTTTIEAYSASGNKKATTTVTVSPITVQEITFENENYAIGIGDKETLVIKINPSNASNKSVTCETSNEEVATASAKGASCIVQGKKVGSVTVTATSKDGAKVARADLKVSAVAVTGISFPATKYTVETDKTITLKPTVKPSNATNKNYTCTSSDSGIASITSGCTIKGKKVGTVTITVYTQDGSKNATATLNVKKGTTSVNLTVATWNMGGWSKYGSIEKKKYGTKLSEYGVDIVGMQEAGSNTSNFKNIASTSGLNNYYISKCSVAGNVIMSKYSLTGKTCYKLPAAGEKRCLEKSVIRVNGVDISFYTTHLSLSKDSKKKEQMPYIAKVLAKDPNPIIFLGDLNVSTCNETTDIVMDALGSDYIRIARATKFYKKALGTYKNSCLDQILINGKGKLSYVKDSAKEVATDGNAPIRFTDHNMIVATVKVTN